MAGIEDVAKRAGVSVATVSRALRGLPNVAPSTRDRVLRAAEDLRYVADPHAARLATRRSATIGLVVPILGQWYYSQIFSGAEGVLAAQGYDLLPFNLSGKDARERFVETLPFRKRVDGLILVDLPLEGDDAERIASADVPMVTMGTEGFAAPGLFVDNRAAARVATRHLINLGHRRIGVLASLPDDPFHFSAPVERITGYEEALRDAGIEPDPRLVVPGNFSFAGGAEGMERMLAADEPPTAVFALSDEMAVGAMKAARDHGYRVPGDLSIIGFDDHDVAEYVGLTTMRQDVAVQGERIAHLMVDVLSGLPRDGREQLDIRLVVRSSTGAAPGS